MQVRQLYADDHFARNKSAVANYHYGYIWAHRPRVEHLTTGHTQGVELSLQTQTDGSKWWQRIHGYPQTGISVMYFDLANPEVVGNATAMIGYINFPLFRNNTFLFSFQTGAGLGYLSKKFDPVSDHKNMGIGSHLNSTIRVGFLTQYKVSKNIYLHLNYAITHFSNAAYRLPNLGINNISLVGGISYQFSEQEKFLIPEIPPVDKRWIAEFVYGTGVKENFPPDGKQFFAHTFYFQFLKPLGHKSRLAIGADGFYDLSLSRFVDEEANAIEKKAQIFRGGIHCGYEMQINHFTVIVHMGYYLIDHTKLDGQFYHRYGLRYEVNKHLFINLSLKTHWGRADYAELGIGWRSRL
ncbi:MAG: acyloxyacyl hydrolase [Bacteroidota bacterium]